MPTSPFHATNYKFRFEIQSELPESLDRLRLGALQLTKTSVGGMLLRAAAADTLVAGVRRRFTRAMASPNVQVIRKRFIANLPGAVNMRRMNFQRGDASPKAEVVKRYLRAAQKMDEARARQDKKMLANAKTSLTAAREKLRVQLKPPRPSKRPLPHGQFRRLAFRVLELVADVNSAKTFGDKTATVLGIGDIDMLDAIKTPSATQALTGRPTKSRLNILWRHLEFGTGAFAATQSQRGTSHRLPSGGWWYGRSKKMSLHLKGSHGVRAIGDPMRNLQHQPEVTKFFVSANQLISKTLFGDN